MATRTGDVYDVCRANNLSAEVCAYMLGNAYSVGNGGQILATLHPDDGNGFPNELLEKIDPFANVPYVLSGGLTQFEDQEVSNNFEFVKGIAISRALHEGLIKL